MLVSVSISVDEGDWELGSMQIGSSTGREQDRLLLDSIQCLVWHMGLQELENDLHVMRLDDGGLLECSSVIE